MDIIWNQRSSRHWTEEGEDWLCLRFSQDDNVSTLILTEDSHHYFSELHIQLEGAEPEDLEPSRLDGPGPFEIALAEMSPCTVLVRVSFYRYHRAPCAVEEVYPVCFGEVTRDGSDDPQRIVMEIGHEAPSTIGHKPAFPHAKEVLRQLSRVKNSSVPELVRSGDTGSMPFMLREDARTDTSIFLFKQTAPLAAFSVGQQILLADWLRAGVDHHIIPAGTWAPRAGNPNAEWSVAVPVARRDEGQGIVGEPFVIKKLISSLRVTPQPPGGVYAEWSWHGPQQWMKVRLQWELYDDVGYADMPPQVVFVSKNEYERRGVIELLHYGRTPGLNGWNVLVTATPFLLGKEFSDQELQSTAHL